MTTTLAEPKKSRRRAAAAPPVDPVTAYARDVVSGAIVAGRAVRLAGERHLRDLKHQRTQEFPYYFDVAAAQHIIDFFPTFLTLENGDPFHLPAWLQFSYGSIYGWKCWEGSDDPAIAARAGLRRFQHGFFETSKGSGKTPSAGGIGLYGAAFDDEPFAEIYSTGFDKDNASIILKDAIRMGRASPDLLEILLIDKYNIAHPSSGSFFRAMSSQHRSKSGPRPHYVLSDEIHEQRDGTVVTKAEAGFKNRSQPLGLKYTNSGSDRSSYCWQLHEKSLNVLEGVTVDEQWFAYVCHLDPCHTCFEEGYRQPKDGCPNCDNWTDQATWPKIAPALGVVIQPKYLQDAVDAALTMPSEFNLKRRLNFCIWTETHQLWISAQRWDACKGPSLLLERKRPTACTAAFDMSEKIDLTAAAFAQRFDDEPGTKADDVDIVVLEGEKEITKTLNLNFQVELTTRFWVPEETMQQRIKNDRIPYDVWLKQGHLEVTPGPIVDHDLIFEQFVSKLAPEFGPTAVGYDPHNAVQFGAALRDRGKFNALEVHQGRRLSEAFKWFEALVLARRIRHNGNPVMAWNVANCELKTDRYRNIWVEKPSAIKRIDGAIAAVMALHLLMLMPKKPEYRIVIVGGRK